jgi:hypothetical protein
VPTLTPSISTATRVVVGKSDVTWKLRSGCPGSAIFGHGVSARSEVSAARASASVAQSPERAARMSLETRLCRGFGVCAQGRIPVSTPCPDERAKGGHGDPSLRYVPSAFAFIGGGFGTLRSASSTGETAVGAGV